MPSSPKTPVPVLYVPARKYRREPEVVGEAEIARGSDTMTTKWSALFFSADLRGISDFASD